MAKAPSVPFQLPFEQLTFDQQANNLFIEANGPVFVHYKAFPCPIGQLEQESIRAPFHDHSNCSNGFIYELAGEFKGTFTSNSQNINLTDLGMVDGSIATLIIPQFYSDGTTPVFISVYDKLYIKDAVVLSTNTEKKQTHITGVDRLTFPVSSVEFLMDSEGKKYSSADFSIQSGNIVWGSNNRPKLDPNTQTGGVYSIRYLYQPFYYVTRLLHEIRIYGKVDLDGNQTYSRAPHQIMIAREKYFHKKQEQGQLDSLMEPSIGLFGAK